MAVDGTYQFNVQTPMGAQKGQMVLKTDGAVLTGEVNGLMGLNVPIKEGSVNGNAFELLLEPKSPVGSIQITIAGKVEGDELSGTATTPLGPMPVTGNRV